jgi:chromosome segregation ATPase
MSLKIDKVQLEIIMKSDTTRAEIIKLEDQAKSLKKEMGKLKNDPAELAKASAEYNKVTSRIKELKDSISLTGMTMKELQDKSKSLQMQLRNLTPGSEKYQQFDKELKEINARMKELRGTAQSTQSGLSNLANGFNKYFALATSFIAAITGASFAFRKLAEDVAHMDDVYSDVMKTTGMGDLRANSSSCNCRPLMPGMRTSTINMPGWSSRYSAKKASALAKDFTR